MSNIVDDIYEHVHILIGPEQAKRMSAFVAMRERAARAAALEEAALLIERDADAAEARWETINDSFGIGSRHVSTLRQYAAAIRALKDGER